MHIGLHIGWRTAAGIALTLAASAAAAAQEAVARPTPDPALVRLVERVERAQAVAAATPGREYANRLRGDHYQAWLKHFCGRGDRPGWPSVSQITGEVERFCTLMEAGPTWPLPPLTRVPRAAVAPVVDGRLNDPAWADAAAFSGLYRFNTVERLLSPATTFKMLWDDRYLYFAFDCADTDIIASDRPRDGPVYTDDCVEMFILPDFQFRTYWEIVVGPNGALFDAVQCKSVEQWGASGDPGRDVIGLQTGITVRGTLNQPGDSDQGYSVEIAVPFAALPGYTRAPPQTGERLHLMLVRLDRQGNDLHCYAFQPLQAWGHNIWNHVVIELHGE